jgi:fatty-acid desaturase
MVPAPLATSAPRDNPAVPSPSANKKRIFWFYATIILIHTLALFAFIPGYTLVWWGIPVVLVGNFIFGSLGINLGYHRMLTHAAAKFPKPLERLWVLLGVCSMEGSPLWWVCTHRMHHQHSDEDGDPHSPQERFFWGHMEWIYTADPRRQKLDTYAKYVPDLMGDKFLRWLHKGEKWLWVWAGHVVLLTALGFGAGFLFFDTNTAALLFGVQWFLWAQLQHQRCQPKQLVCRVVDQWRRLAQQPPRGPKGVFAGPPLVGDRPHLHICPFVATARLGVGCCGSESPQTHRHRFTGGGPRGVALPHTEELTSHATMEAPLRRLHRRCPRHLAASQNSRFSILRSGNPGYPL